MRNHPSFAIVSDCVLSVSQAVQSLDDGLIAFDCLLTPDDIVRHLDSAIDRLSQARIAALHLKDNEISSSAN